MQMSCTSSGLGKTPAKLKKDPAKTVRVVALTRLDTFCDGQPDRQTHVRGWHNISPNPEEWRHN